jgi:hypothetical protein
MSEHNNPVAGSENTGQTLELSASKTLRELNARTADGKHVRLLWDQLNNELFVDLEDSRSGEVFVIPVRDPNLASDVFNHPYPYAAAEHAAVQRKEMHEAIQVGFSGLLSGEVQVEKAIESDQSAT